MTKDLSKAIEADEGASQLLHSLRDLIQNARQRALRAVDAVQVQTCWEIGRHIVEFEQGGSARAEYGTRLLQTVASSLAAEFGRGFDVSNLRHMRVFYQAFPIRDALRPELSWTHYRTLLRVESDSARHWYMTEAADQGWTTRSLERPLESDLAEQILKDPYNFDFLTVTATAKEREIENGLLSHLRDLLLELGRGFSFVGSQVPLTVDDRTFYIDLLFYHVRLHRFFVFELKVGDFEPEYAGKLSFYLSAVNRTMRTPIEGPSIGVLLCESRSGPLVEFALENINQPIGVSTYRVTRELPAPIQDELPTVEDLQEVVNKLRTEIATLRKEPSDGE